MQSFRENLLKIIYWQFVEIISFFFTLLSNADNFHLHYASESPGEVFLETYRYLSSTPRDLVLFGQGWGSGIGILNALQVILKCSENWEPLILSYPLIL